MKQRVVMFAILGTLCWLELAYLDYARNNYAAGITYLRALLTPRNWLSPLAGIAIWWPIHNRLFPLKRRTQ